MMETIDRIDDDSPRRLDPRSVLVRRLAGWIFAAIFGGSTLLVVAGIVALGRPSRAAGAVFVAAWVALAALLVFRAQVWPGLAYRYASYRVSPAGIEIRRGVLWREVHFIPRSRVQHTDVAQGPIERQFGLATLVLYTAGTAHAAVHVSGLDRDTALRIRDHLVAGGVGDGV